eukprot:5613908-Pyramimonas_sp.AAC.1
MCETRSRHQDVPSLCCGDAKYAIFPSMATTDPDMDKACYGSELSDSVSLRRFWPTAPRCGT